MNLKSKLTDLTNYCCIHISACTADIISHIITYEQVELSLTLVIDFLPCETKL